MVVRVSATAVREVGALISAMKLLNRETAKYIRAEVKTNADPIVREALRGHAITRMQVRGIVDTTRVTVSDQNVQVKAGAVRGGFKRLDPRVSVRSMEFGSSGGRVATYQRRSKNGGTHTVHNRHTMRQFGPAAKKGNVFYPAIRDSMAHRIVALYVQTFLRTVYEAVEKR